MRSKNLFVYLGLFAFSVHLWGQKANLVIPMGHAQQVNQIDVSYDFSKMASIDDTHIIHIWDVPSKREVFQLKDHDDGLMSIDFHPQKLHLVSGDVTGNVFLWDMSSEQITQKIKTDDTNSLVQFIGEDKVVVAGAKKIAIYNYTNGQELVSQNTSESFQSIHFSDEQSLLIAGTVKGSLIHFNTGDLSEQGRFFDVEAPISAITTYTDRPVAIIGYHNGMVAKVNLEEYSLIRKEKVFDEQVGGLMANSADGGVIVAGRGKDDDIKVLGKNLLPAISRFKWSSRRRNQDILKGLAWGNKEQTDAFIADHANVVRHWNYKEREWQEGLFKGTARPVYDIDINGNGERLIIGTRQSQIKIFDMTGAKYPELLPGHRNGIVQLDHHHSGDLILAVGRDNEIKVWNAQQGEIKATIKRPERKNFNMEFTVGRNFIRKTGPSTYESYNFKTKKSREITLGGAYDMKISPDGESIYFRRDQELAIYHSYDLEAVGKIAVSSPVDFGFAGNNVVVLGDGMVSVFSNGLKSKEFAIAKNVDRIMGLSTGDFLVYSSEPSRSHDYQIYHFDTSGKLISTLSAHFDYVTTIIEHNNRLLSASLDGSIQIWELKKEKYEQIGTLITLRQDNFVVLTPDNLFDASPEALVDMHFTRGGEIIALEQLKDVYYEPNLFPKLMGYGSSELRKPLDISKIGSAPKVEVTQHPNVTGGTLGIKVTDAGGGLGRIVLTINGKEVSSDLQNSRGVADYLELEYDVKGHPYLYSNKPSRVTIKAYNKDQTLNSEPKSIFILPFEGAKPEEAPKIYAVVIGSSDYASDDMDLQYAAKDAEDFASALKMSSSNLIGGANLKLTKLTTAGDSSTWPNKENIKKAFENYAKEAKARDYLIVYMAGHGLNSGGEDGDFYYLTCTATEGKVSNKEMLSKDAISSAEFTEYIKSVPAINQVMIVDACHSGTLTSSFGRDDVSKTMDSEEVKAYERMKDRTGIFLLAGSAADAVSYETTLYGQGLLTYALLFGMKGAALRDGEYIDVLDLFQFAAKKVPQLAADIGGIQRPEVRVPNEVESFNIGKMTEADKKRIKLLSPKPVFVHTSFQDDAHYNDVDGIGVSLDARLLKVSKKENAPIIFMNENRFSGAYVVRGRYQRKGSLISVQVKVFEEDDPKGEFKVEGVNANAIADKIMDKLMKMI